MNNRRFFFKQLACGLVAAVSPGLFLPKLIKPVWKLPVHPKCWGLQRCEFGWCEIPAPIAIDSSWHNNFESYVEQKYHQQLSIAPPEKVVFFDDPDKVYIDTLFERDPATREWVRRAHPLVLMNIDNGK